MTDEPKGAPAEGEGSAAPASASPPAATDAASGANEESAEQRAARLERELSDQKALNASWKEKVEKANEVLRAQSAQPTTPPAGMGAGDPLEARIATLEGLAIGLRGDLAAYPNDNQVKASAVAVGLELERLYAARAERAQRSAWEQRLREAEAHFATLPARIATKARELFATGEYASAQAATVAARGAVLPDDFDVEAERQRLAKEREELAKDRAAREAGRIGTGSRPLFAGQKPQTNGTFRISRAQAREIAAKPYNDPDRVAYNEAYARGAVEFVD